MTDSTYDPVHDDPRIRTLRERVFDMMEDGDWWTLAVLQRICGGSEAGVSARIRDFRKPQYGAHIVERRRRGDPRTGLWEYRLIVREQKQQDLFNHGPNRRW